MDLLTREEFAELMTRREPPCVSIYLPTHRAGKEIEQGPIRLKNSLREAQEKMAAMDIRSSDAEEWLAPARALQQDGRFWRHQSDGLALFIAPGYFRHFRLPLGFEPLVVVTERFHIKPVLPLLKGDGRFYILALSQKDVRLLEGSRYSVSAVEIENVPKSLSEALKYDVGVKLGQWRGFTRDISGKNATPQAGGTPLYQPHGASGDPDGHDKDIWQYFLQLDRGLRDYLPEGKAPLVLAAVEYLMPIYHEANTYPHLLSEGIRGNPELLRPEELHEKAWKVVEPEFRRAEEDAAEQYRNLLGSGRTSDSILEIVPAAAQGRVDALFVPLGIQQWGEYDPESGEVQVHLDKKPGSQDILDLAAYHTLANSGTVYALEPEYLPDAAPAAAILRY